VQCTRVAPSAGPTLGAATGQWLGWVLSLKGVPQNGRSLLAASIVVGELGLSVSAIHVAKARVLRRLQDELRGLWH
jgi:hypothetical protein